MSKYADDGYLIVPPVNSTSIHIEMEHIATWAKEFNLNLNLSKTQEIIIHRKNINGHSLPPQTPEIKRVDTLKVLGVTLDRHLSFSHHVDNILSSGYQRLYALKIMKSHGMPSKNLSQLTQTIF